MCKRFICILLSLAFVLPLFSCTVKQTGETDAPDAATEAAETEPAVNEDGYLTKAGTRVDGETVGKYPQLTNLPTLYIEIDARKGIYSVQHGVYSDATYTLVDGSHTNSYYELPLKIKGRGNYSWTLRQKPYTLKLDKKADLLGMGEAKKWVLVTVNSDKTMIRNYITQKCAKWLGLPGTCDNEYVDVIVNGEYFGTYVLTEKIEIGENRIEAEKSKSTLFEIEVVVRHTCDLCVVMWEKPDDPGYSVHLTFKSYHGKDTDELTDGERAEALLEFRPFFKNVENAMKGHDLEELERYIDVDSFVNWYLLHELTRNLDSRFITSCYCFVDETGKLFMGPCWDYDTCYGAQIPEYDGAWINQEQTAWFYWLLRYNKPFIRACRARWTELRQEGNDIGEWFEANIDSTVAMIAQSEKLEHKKYPECDFANYEYPTAVKYMKWWIRQRIKWMDGEFLQS